MSPTTTITFTERQSRAIERILESMDRSASRAELMYSGMRQHERKPYCGPLSVYFPTDEKPFPPFSGNDGCTPAWSYSLSQGGVGLIMLPETPSNEVWVGVHRPNGTIRWMHGRIVRRREIPEEDFFDYGIRFETHARDEQASPPGE